MCAKHLHVREEVDPFHWSRKAVQMRSDTLTGQYACMMIYQRVTNVSTVVIHP